MDLARLRKSVGPTTLAAELACQRRYARLALGVCRKRSVSLKLLWLCASIGSLTQAFGLRLLLEELCSLIDELRPLLEARLSVSVEQLSSEAIFGYPSERATA